MKKNQHISTDVELLCVVQGELGQSVIDVEFILVVKAFGGIAATAVAEKAEVHKTTEEQEVNKVNRKEKNKTSGRVKIGGETQVQAEVGTERPQRKIKVKNR